MKFNKKEIFETSVVFVVIMVVICFVLAAWKLERWINYKTSYSYQVSEQVQPLVDRVMDLEKRVDALEKK